MQIVKGVLLFYNYNPKPTIEPKCKAFKINDKLSFYSISYQKDEKILKIFIEIGPTPLKNV
jgi:hypothetical protein